MRLSACTIAAPLVLMAGVACQVSPIPKEIETYHAMAQEEYPRINSAIQVGDLIFRKGHARILNNTVDFSNLTSNWCHSPFSHVSLVYEQHGDTFIILDTGPYGVERKFLVDWLIQGPENVVVKRLQPEYRRHIPGVLAAAHALVERDVLYDDKYKPGDDRFYCTEIVDHCFREAGIPLAEMVRIRDFPSLRPWPFAGMAWAVGNLVRIPTHQPVVIAGNDEIGLFSSKLLTEVGVTSASPADTGLALKHAPDALGVAGEPVGRDTGGVVDGGEDRGNGAD